MILFHYFIIMILAGLLKQLLELTKLIKRLQHGLNNLHEQKFKHSWQDSFNPLCSCRCGEIESFPITFVTAVLKETQQTITCSKSTKNVQKGCEIWSKLTIKTSERRQWRNTFISKARLKLAKNQAKAKQQPRLNFSYLKIIHFFHPCHHQKLIWDILKKCIKDKCICFNEIYDWL